MKAKSCFPVVVLLLALGAEVVSPAAWAADKAAGKKGIEGLPLSDALDSAAAGAAPAPVPKEAKIKMTRRQCARLVVNSGAGAAYEPGVDAHGRKVAPVEMKSGLEVAPPKEISFDINYDLASKITGAGGKVYEPRFKVGTVTVKDGVPYFNGRPLGDQEQKRLAEACKKIMK